MLKEVQRKVVLDHHQDDSMKQHSVVTSVRKQDRIAITDIQLNQ